MSDEEVLKRPTSISISESENIRISRVVDGTDALTFDLRDSKNLEINEVLKTGRGPLLVAERINGLVLNEVRQELPLEVKREIASCLERGDRSGFLDIFQRWSRKLPPERADALLNMVEKIWRSLPG